MVVELGEGAFGEVFFMAQFRQDAVGVGAFVHTQGCDFGHAVGPLLRVEPVVAQVDEMGLRALALVQLKRRAAGAPFGDEFLRGVMGQ